MKKVVSNHRGDFVCRRRSNAAAQTFRNLQCSVRMLRVQLNHMQEWYVGRGIQLLVLDDCCQLVAREEFREPIKKALGIRHGGNLSKSSFEVLAIVAYHQPVTRSYIDEVRGVDSGHLLTSLYEKGLIESQGRLDLPGRPSIWGTTPDFLRVFGLSSLKNCRRRNSFWIWPQISRSDCITD